MVFSLSTYLDLEQPERPPFVCVWENVLRGGKTHPGTGWHRPMSWGPGRKKRIGGESKLNTRTHFSSHSHVFIVVMDQSLPNVSSEKPFSLGCWRCWVTLGRKVPGTFISPWSWVNVEPKTYTDHRLCRRRESTLKGRERTERRAHSVLNTSKTPHDHHRKINLKYELKLAWFPVVLRFSHGFEVDFEAEQLECMKAVRFCKSNSPLRN